MDNSKVVYMISTSVLISGIMREYIEKSGGKKCIVLDYAIRVCVFVSME